MDIQKVIERKLESIDISSMVESEIRDQIQGDVARSIRDCVKEKINDLVKIEFDLILKKGVQTDDGWGNKDSFDSFEDLFKREFQKKLEQSYEMKRTIQSQVKEKLEKLFQKELKDVMNAIAENLIREAKEKK